MLCHGQKDRQIMRRLLTLLATVMVLVGLMAAPAVADPQGFSEDEFEYGFFYGTFDQSPNVALFAGGRIEEFCFGDPGMTTSRTFVRQDGSVDVKVNDKDQPIYLYDTDFNDVPEWLEEICPGIIAETDAPPVPFASGTANLKVRESYLFEDGPPERIFNSVNGRATGPGGTRYIVRGEADVPFEYGAPVGTPPDWVSFELREIGS
jgi:hypothetical protein